MAVWVNPDNGVNSDGGGLLTSSWTGTGAWSSPESIPGTATANAWVAVAAANGQIYVVFTEQRRLSSGELNDYVVALTRFVEGSWTTPLVVTQVSSNAGVWSPHIGFTGSRGTILWAQGGLRGGGFKSRDINADGSLGPTLSFGATSYSDSGQTWSLAFGGNAEFVAAGVDQASLYSRIGAGPWLRYDGHAGQLLGDDLVALGNSSALFAASTCNNAAGLKHHCALYLLRFSSGHWRRTATLFRTRNFVGGDSAAVSGNDVLIAALTTHYQTPQDQMIAFSPSDGGRHFTRSVVASRTGSPFSVLTGIVPGLKGVVVWGNPAPSGSTHVVTR